MKIGVLSDTHSREIPAQVLKALEKVDLIIHAGDFCRMQDVKQLSKIKDLKAVYGNADEPEVVKKLPKKIIFECQGIQIGVFHGEGAALKILDSVSAQFKKDKVDIIIFGHSHQAFNERIKNILYFNPGSPNDDVIAPYCSYGLLEVANTKVVGKIIKL